MYSPNIKKREEERERERERERKIRRGKRS